MVEVGCEVLEDKLCPVAESNCQEVLGGDGTLALRPPGQQNNTKLDAFEEVVKFERRWDCRRRSLVHPNVESGVVVELTTAPTIPNQHPGLAIARKKERKDHADVSTGVNHGVWCCFIFKLVWVYM